MSYIKGLLIEDWVDSQDCQLECCLLAPLHADYISDSSETLWNEFEATFKSAWKNGEKVQSAYKTVDEVVHDLNINLYMATFKQLSLAVGWEPDA